MTDDINISDPIGNSDRTDDHASPARDVLGADFAEFERRCEALASKRPFFRGDPAEIIEIGELSLELVDQMAVDELFAVKIAETVKARGTTYSPSLKKLEILAVKYVTHPRDDREHDACGRFAAPVVEARLAGVTPGNFAKFYSGKTLTGSIRARTASRKVQLPPKLGCNKLKENQAPNTPTLGAATFAAITDGDNGASLGTTVPSFKIIANFPNYIVTVFEYPMPDDIVEADRDGARDDVAYQRACRHFLNEALRCVCPVNILRDDAM